MSRKKNQNYTIIKGLKSLMVGLIIYTQMQTVQKIETAHNFTKSKKIGKDIFWLTLSNSKDQTMKGNLYIHAI